MKTKYAHIIWDFNGTVLDDVTVGFASVNAMLARRGLPEVASVEDYRRDMRFPVSDYYRALGFDFSRESYDSVAEEWVDGYLSRENEAPLTAGLRETVAAFIASGARQVIISACESGILNAQLKKRGADIWFDEIIGVDNVHAAGKLDIAVDYAKRHAPEALLFIGDTVHDLECAKAASEYCETDCILYSGGHGSRDALIKTGAPVTGKLTDILKIIRRTA